MGLSHLNFGQEDVVTPGGAFVVRGLSFADITAIVRPHANQLSALFDSLKDGKFDLDDPISLVSTLLAQAPEAAAQIIATAANEVGEAGSAELAVARKLAFPVQIEALEKIAHLTFVSEGGAKKVLETIIRVAKGASTTLVSLKA